jgi:hypothetical protein
MREPAPRPFAVSVVSDDGPYVLNFRPTDKWDGTIDVVIRGHAMTWDVLTVDREADGTLTLSGSTYGSQGIWNDEFWYVLRVATGPASVSYYGDQVCWRTDYARETDVPIHAPR